MTNIELVSAVTTAIENGNEGAFSSNWNPDDAEAGFWINIDDYQNVCSALKGESLWRPIISAPKDGTHIFACDASIPYGQYWTFGQRPPTVVHWFEDGFYTSVNELEPQRPFPATHWQSLPVPPTN